jgi:hypothetical protein
LPWAPGAGHVDRQIADTVPCEGCGGVGGEYRPFHDPHARSYRAFAVCRRCGHANEF